MAHAGTGRAPAAGAADALVAASDACRLAGLVALPARPVRREPTPAFTWVIGPAG
jgi:hypothetical protein